MKDKLLLLFVLFVNLTYSQNGLKGNSIDYTYIERPEYELKFGEKYNPDTLFDHPEFGILPFDKPYGKNVVEDLSKRNAYKRYYVDLDNPNFFYIQKSATPINFKRDNDWIAISSLLEKESNNVYSALNQPFPTSVNISEGVTSIKINAEEIIFNNYSMTAELMNGGVVSYEANWSDVKVGNEAIYITNLFPDIDFRIQFKKGAIKSEFVFNSESDYKRIKFSDYFQMPSHFEITDTVTSNLPFISIINTLTEQECAKIGKVRSYDFSGIKEGWTHEYEINGSQLSFELDSSFLHNSNVVYPLIIDPLVTAVGPVFGGISGSVEAPAECSNNINVLFPGGSTPWDVSATWNVYTQECIYWDFYGFYYPCFMAEAQVELESSCGGLSPSPGNSWQCLGCNTPGTWTPALPFNSAGTQSLAQCYAPSCSNQTLSFDLNINRASGCTQLFGVYDNCNWNNSLCVSLDAWSVTVQGRTIETLGNSSTGNGSTSLIASSCAGGVTTTLDPTPEYGVPGYTYNWSTGESTPTIDVSGFTTGDIFTADVTDACGSTATATFEVTCPLSVDLLNFTAENLDESVVLRWATASERDNDFFEVLRSSDDKHFESIGTIQGAGNATSTNYYSFVDNSPESGINYYKLRIVDFDGVEEFSAIESVNRVSIESSIVCIPNPAKDKVNLIFNFPEDDFYTISIFDMMGKEVYQTKTYFEKGTNSHMIKTGELPSNVYNVQIITNNHVHSSRLVIE